MAHLPGFGMWISMPSMPGETSGLKNSEVICPSLHGAQKIDDFWKCAPFPRFDVERRVSSAEERRDR